MADEERDGVRRWAARIGSVLAMLPEASVHEIFATPETLLSGVFAPRGKAVAMDGGFAARTHLDPNLICRFVPVTAKGNLFRTVAQLRAKLRAYFLDARL